MWRFGSLLLLLLAPPVWANQVCLHKGTGRLLEYQSGGITGTCTANLIAAGIPKGQIQERVITASEWAVLREEQLETPARVEREAKKAQRAILAATLQTKLSLSPKEFADLKEALRD